MSGLERVRVGLVGVSGYTGAEALRLLVGHPAFEVAALFGSTARDRVDHEIGWARGLGGVGELGVEVASAGSVLASGVEVVVLATPHETAATLAPELVNAGVRVVDLSAAFRLRDAAAYPTWYGFEHPMPSMLASAVYGLPELSRDGLEDAALVAAPGCYPTASILGIAPLLARGLIDPASPVIIDAVSGVSGAGRGASTANLFCEVSQRPYGLFTHRHRPEIAQGLGVGTSGVIFTPSVGPYDRGIVATIHAEVGGGVSSREISDAFDLAYRDEPFVRLSGDLTVAGAVVPSVGAVARTNFCDIGFAVEGSRVIVISAIDNLTKGAAGQGVQCLNAMFGFDETLGLLPGLSSGVEA